MPLPTDLVTLADVQTHLNWSTAQETQYGRPMDRFISATTAVVEAISGPVVIRSFDEWYTGGKQRIQLDNYPVTTITKVTETYGAGVTWTLTPEPVDGSGAPLDVYGYTVDLPMGILIRRMSGVTATFAGGERNVHVVYSAGMCAATANVPSNIALAALELIRINWQPQQGGNRPAVGNPELAVADAMKMGFFVPNRVLEILRPNANRFAIA